MNEHISVLKKEVVEYLNPREGGIFVDGTVGAAGHSQALLKKIQGHKKISNFKFQILNLKIIAIDVDETAIQLAKKNLAKYKGQVIFVNDNFVNLKEIVTPLIPHLSRGETEGLVDGILLDLGLSSMQLESSGRGFSFRKNESLDMRFGTGYEVLGNRELTAEKVVNQYSETELVRIFFEFGEERSSRQIARVIVANRASNKIKTTKELVKIIGRAIPESEKRMRKIHFATKVFQALRIEVNQELKNLEETIPQAIGLLKPKGRLVIINFHSLEDRIVKTKFKELARGCTCPPELVKYKCACGKTPQAKIVTKKPIIPTDEEIRANPRARSAKLRVLENL